MFARFLMKFIQKIAEGNKNEAKKNLSFIYDFWSNVPNDKLGNQIRSALDQNIDDIAHAIKKGAKNDGDIAEIVQDLVNLYNGVKMFSNDSMAINYGEKLLDAIRKATI